MTLSAFENILNDWGRVQVPFLFLVDFEMKKPRAWRIEDVDSAQMKFHFNRLSNATNSSERLSVNLKKSPIPFDSYCIKFDQVMKELDYGNSFLTNLTIKTPIELDVSLEQLFEHAVAPYKLWIKNELVVFSPETFVSIRDGKIYSYPMKGTIDARIENALEKIVADPKELAEHVTIVDLIRNDLSRVASQVHVKRFRYVDRLETNRGPLLQVSSEIVGDLPRDFHQHIGTLLLSLLPAGSISGAPKDKTVNIIEQAEAEERGYYTGVFGYFNGTHLDSGVLIRYIEQVNDQLYFRSGGGITTQSDARAEYDEAITKVYVPIV